MRRPHLAYAAQNRLIQLAIGGLIGIALSVWLTGVFSFWRSDAPQLLTDPFLQAPTARSVKVVWFTEFAGTRHFVQYGWWQQRATATTTQLSRMREDQQSHVGPQVESGQVYQQPIYRNIWRHEAEVSGITQRTPYRVISVREDQQTVRSRRFTLTATPPAGTPLKILLTSDHQLKPMTPANLQKVVETIGQVDAVFLAGDLVDVADRASEWFDDNRGNAFFPSLQGRAAYDLENSGQKIRYSGGAIIQSAPLFPAIGNHEVMGRFSMQGSLNDQFNDSMPRQVAAQLYQQNAARINPVNSPVVETSWIKNHSFNTDSYEELFTLPAVDSNKYYAVTIGDVRLITLFATNIWRSPSLRPAIKGRYREREADLNQPEQWGYGQHIFESITPGSAQYAWLQSELNRPEFQQAKYKVVMFHHPPHSVGDNIVPAYTAPMQIIEREPDGQIATVRYEYPLEADYLIRDVLPLLEAAGVQLVFYGHSHLWNRFISPAGMHFLESSNVGNTYGAFTGEKRRQIPIDYSATYVAIGDPNGLQPVVPTLAPLSTQANSAQPYLASNDITAFSILDTATGLVTSYRFDTRQPNSAVIQFDQFSLLKPLPQSKS